MNARIGSFFQNNNSILPDLIAYVGDQLRAATAEAQPRYLVDAYCGSGLFSISLASRFDRVKGVEISGESVRAATHNATLNKVENVAFIEGKAEAIFAVRHRLSVSTDLDLTFGTQSIDFAASETTVIVDPPRKGCDEPFLAQLVAFAPASIVYVSCSVHTQAPDVGYLVTKGAYDLVSLRGVDLFPQTHHVESVAVLRKRVPAPVLEAAVVDGMTEG
jgi:tRNA (uracil-5-)-methyltransferase